MSKYSLKHYCCQNFPCWVFVAGIVLLTVTMFASADVKAGSFFTVDDSGAILDPKGNIWAPQNVASYNKAADKASAEFNSMSLIFDNLFEDPEVIKILEDKIMRMINEGVTMGRLVGTSETINTLGLKYECTVRPPDLNTLSCAGKDDCSVDGIVYHGS